MAIFELDAPADPSCIIFNGFTSWKNLDFGFYLQSTASLELKNSVIAENGLGVFTFVIGPSATGHSYADKSATIDDNVFIGKTSSFSESDDVMDSNDLNIALSSDGRSPGSSRVCGKYGMSATIFSSGGNSVPEKPFNNIMKYQAIMGLTQLNGKEKQLNTKFS